MVRREGGLPAGVWDLEHFRLSLRRYFSRHRLVSLSSCLCQGTVELRDGDRSSGSVKLEVVRHAGSQQSLQSVLVSRLSDTGHQGVFTLRITVS